MPVLPHKVAAPPAERRGCPTTGTSAPPPTRRMPGGTGLAMAADGDEEVEIGLAFAVVGLVLTLAATA